MSRSKLNVWIFNHYACNMYFNKGGRHYWFAKELTRRGYLVTVFCSSKSSASGVNYPDFAGLFRVEACDGFNFVFINNKVYKENGIDRIANMFRFYFRLKKVARIYGKQNGNPDVIIGSSVHPLAMVAGIQAAKRFRKPCICEIRDLWPEAIFAYGKAKENSVLGHILVNREHWIYKKANALVFTKEGDVDYLKEKKWDLENGGDISLKKCFYINNGIVIDEFINQAKCCFYDDADLNRRDSFNVVYCGTIRPVNKVGAILDAAKIIQNTEGCSNIKFLIFGNGSELSDLRRRLEDEQISNVVFKGSVAREKIPYILSKSSLNLLNYSDKYNWSRGNSSNKLFEYMASGKPIISTVQMGYSIINKYHCGVELDECTPECLATNIIKFSTMEANEYENYCKNAFIGAQDFDFSILTNKLEEVIRYVLQA